jgi:hypothetical protein
MPDDLSPLGRKDGNSSWDVVGLSASPPAYSLAPLAPCGRRLRLETADDEGASGFAVVSQAGGRSTRSTATDAPTLDGVTVHLADVDELRRTWFVVFDGGGDPSARSADLALAEGQSGVLTYDGDVGQSVRDHLRNRYVAAG